MNKSLLIKDLQHFVEWKVFNNGKRGLNQVLDSIMYQHYRVTSGFYCFRYRGNHYGKHLYLDVQLPVPHPIPPLHPSLHSTMDEYLKNLHDFEFGEIPLVLGYIREVVVTCRNSDEVKRLLPEVLHTSVGQWVTSSTPTSKPALPERRLVEMEEKYAPYMALIRRKLTRNLLESE